MSYQSKFTGAEIDAGIEAANAALPKSGGTMIGALLLAGDPTDEKGAVTKKYVDDAVQNIASTPGADGEDGVSPTITVTEITGGHRITITDANGAQSFEVMDGEDGADGSGGDGSGDMLKSVYDADNDGTVDNAAKLGGKAPSEFYGRDNQPPYPVTSVNGMTGDVVISSGGGTGDMQKGVYDVDGSGIVDDAERLGGKLPEEYADSEHTHAHISITYPQSCPEGQHLEPTAFEEQFTGDYWIDGKPIYRKTIGGNIQNSNDTEFARIGAVDTLVKMHGSLKTSDNHRIPVNAYHSDSFRFMAWVENASNGSLKCRLKPFGEIWVVVEYTKPD